MKVVFWWNIPCVGMIHVLKSYSEDIDASAIVVTGTLSNSRKSMGWDDKGKLFDSHIVLQDNEWESHSHEILEQYKDRLHVFNGITHPERMKRVINYAIKKGIQFCNMSEAYSNLSFGLRRLVKTLYIKYYLPRLVKPIAQHSSGVLCLSGNAQNNLKQFEHLGFARDAIFPFGYYTNEDTTYSYRPAQDGKMHILCPGLLEKYKGVDILVLALHLITKQGISNYICHITGKGSQEARLKSLTSKLKLERYVVFEGVLDSRKYNDLLSHIDILVAPGRVEPWGIRINEAIQRGNAVIVSSGLGAAELVQASKGGAVFRNGDAADLASKLCYFLSDKSILSEAKRHNLDYKHHIGCQEKASQLFCILNELTHRNITTRLQ